ncbi:phage holin family protein [Cohnella silvisoli]|uniref:Phage holin family protein n=1 Tax=Cohnella silvisoli TaxID=2873699 RepID=A0ABV1L4R7_9BACL|nr:phage holin family protein [Cohnella silvisoli]MCD9026061.1 phage holin family protein [Cohnella silvisoli]
MNQGKELVLNLWTAAAGTNSKEAAWGGWVAIAGTVGALLGGWDKSLQLLLVLMVADYVTGVLGAIKLKRVNSDTMYWGGIRKVTVLFVVGLAALLDDWLQPGAPVFRTAAIYFYVGREGLSVVENLGTMGTPLPSWLKTLLQQLGEKGEEKANG